MKDKPKNCGTCAYLRVLPNAAGRRVVHKDRAYTCLWGFSTEGQEAKSELLSVLPHALGVKWEKRYMEAREGSDCPAWRRYTGGSMGPGGCPPGEALEAAGDAVSRLPEG